MRRWTPTIAAIVLLALPAACGEDGPEGGPGGPDSAPGYGGPRAKGEYPDESRGPGGPGGPDSGYGAPPAAPTGPIAAPPGTPMVERPVEIAGNAETLKVTEAPLFIDGYYSVQFADTGLPRAAAVPTFRWITDSAARTWPAELTVELPSNGRTQLVAWVDLDGSGGLSSGDRCGRAVEALPYPADGTEPEAGVVAMRIDRIFVAAGAEPTRSAHTFHLDGSQAARNHTSGTLLVLGFTASQIQQNGFPDREARPSVDWKKESGSLTWPTVVHIELPPTDDLWLLPVLDLNEDGHLSPGDMLGTSRPFVAPATPGDPVLLLIDQELPSAPPAGSGGRPGAPEAGGGGCGG